CPEAVCRGVGREKITVANGNHTLPGRGHRDGVTSDGAENAPRLRVFYGEDSKESGPPVKRRVEIHTASAQDSSVPVPWRWRSRGARIRESSRPQLVSQDPLRAAGRHAEAPTVQRVGRCGRRAERFDANLLRWGGPTRANRRIPVRSFSAHFPVLP